MGVTVGILGFAHGHVNSYCRMWREQPELGVTVVAGWDHDAERLAKSAEQHGIEAQSDIDALLARDDIKGVVIAAETSMHADLVEKAAAAGKTIVLQKPMALTIPQADRIVAAVNKAGVPFTMAWQMRADAQNRKIKELVDSGDLGQVFMVRRRHGLGVGLNPGFYNSWHVNPKYNRDIWADDSSHCIDFLHWLLGAPESITAEIESLYNPAMPMDNGIAIFRFPGGPVAEVCCSFTAPAYENTTEVIAEKGSIIQNYGDGPSCNVPRPEGAKGLKWYLSENKDWTYSDLPTPPSHGNRIAGLSQPLSDFLNGKGAPIATAEEGRTSLRMVLACYVSSREGRRVGLDDPKIDEV